MISYCHGCGVYAALDAAALCDRCRAAWQPAEPAPADLGTRTQQSGAP